MICGERISCGSGEMRSEGRRSWRMRIAVSQYIQSVLVPNVGEQDIGMAHTVPQLYGALVDGAVV